MIISHKHEFIFLKTTKTAGTSIELALSSICGEDDVITPLFRDDERFRKRRGFPRPRNFRKDLKDYGKKDWQQLLLRMKPSKLFYNHMPAREVRDILGEETWRRYFKFCFERNPWDRVLSMYYWKNRKKRWNSISEFINKKNLKPLKKKGYYIYTIDNEIAVDKVYPYEKLQESLDDLCNRLDLPLDVELPKAKANYRSDKRDYSEVLSDEERDFIADYFNIEIDLLNYQCE